MLLKGAVRAIIGVAIWVRETPRIDCMHARLAHMITFVELCRCVCALVFACVCLHTRFRVFAVSICGTENAANGILGEYVDVESPPKV